ncbi:MAG: hypothetical protein ABII12_08065 [Planctomycetota bacterium]
MLQRRPITGFFLKLTLLYGLLLVPWPGLSTAYLGCLHWAGNHLYGSFGSNGLVHLDVAPEGMGQWNTLVMLMNQSSGVRAGLLYQSRQDYLATALVLSLILATPIPWKRRWKALLWGLLAIHGFVAFRLLIWLIDVFSGDNTLAIFTLSQAAKSVIHVCANALLVAPEATFVVPVPIWILVTIRRADVRRWREMIESGRNGGRN